jgi:hypothetical protein
MSAGCDAVVGAAFRADIVNFVNFGGAVDVQLLDSAHWASVTFAGARHRLRVVLEGTSAIGAAADFLAALPELEFTIPGHIVADVALVAEERGDAGDYAVLELEALTIDES